MLRTKQVRTFSVRLHPVPWRMLWEPRPRHLPPRGGARALARTLKKRRRSRSHRLSLFHLCLCPIPRECRWQPSVQPLRNLLELPPHLNRELKRSHTSARCRSTLPRRSRTQPMLRIWLKLLLVTHAVPLPAAFPRRNPATPQLSRLQRPRALASRRPINLRGPSPRLPLPVLCCHGEQYRQCRFSGNGGSGFGSFRNIYVARRRDCRNVTTGNSSRSRASEGCRHFHFIYSCFSGRTIGGFFSGAVAAHGLYRSFVVRFGRGAWSVAYRHFFIAIDERFAGSVTDKSIERLHRNLHSSRRSFVRAAGGRADSGSRCGWDCRQARSRTMRSASAVDAIGSSAQHPQPVPGMSGAPSPVSVSVAQGDNPAAVSSLSASTGNAAHTSAQDTFAALDSSSSAAPTWVHAGQREAEAGFQDPSLGWIGVRADASSSGVHATLLPSSYQASQELGGHLAGLNSYLSEQRTPVETLTLASPFGGDSSPMAGQNANQGMNQGTGERASGQGSAEPSAIQTSAASSVSSATAAPAPVGWGSGSSGFDGRHISVVA